MLINYNGKIIKNNLNILSRFLNYGDGFFETIKIINGIPFNINFHFKRLKQGAKAVKINFPFKNIDDFLYNIDMILHRSEVKGGILKIVVFRDSAGNYLPKNNDSSFILKIKKSKHNSFVVNQKSLRLCVYDIKKQVTPYCFFKSTSSLYYVMASIYFKENGFDGSLLLNNDNIVVETNNSNIFFVKGDRIITPSISTGCVDGSMRDLVIKILSKNNKYILQEKNIYYKEIDSFSEVFITNAISGLVSIKKINNFLYKDYTLRDKLIHEIKRLI